MQLAEMRYAAAKVSVQFVQRRASSRLIESLDQRGGEDSAAELGQLVGLLAGTA